LASQGNYDIILTGTLKKICMVNNRIKTGVKLRMFRIKGFKSFPLKTLSDRRIYRGGKNEKDIF